MLRARPVLIAVTLAALPLLAACGDDEDPETTPTTTSVATAEPTSEATSTPTEAATETSTPEATATATEEATETPTEAATATETAEAGGGEERTSTIASFTLETFTVPVGTTVVWQNDDDTPHTATASDGSFDSGSLDQGGTFSHTFEEAGTFEYACAIHPTMTGTVTVE